ITSSNILATPRCRNKACAQLVPVLPEHWTGRGRKKKLSENRLRAPGNVGGADEDRTHDLLNAIQALAQTELRPHGTKRLAGSLTLTGHQNSGRAARAFYAYRG